jgi:ribosomal protein S18 acetylase RimI-like enzyme
MIVPTLRNLGIDDYDAIIQLWQRAGLHSMRPEGRDSRDAFAAQLAAGQKIIGLEERGRLIGTVVITHDTRKGWINRLAVHPEYRRKGYAAQLLAAAEKELQAMRIRVFAVLIEADNVTSQKFFAREGYKTHDIVYMTKRENAEA